MATVWGSLAQVQPSANTLTLAYTVPALKHAAVQFVANNSGSSDALIRISIAPGGAADALSQYVLYDYTLSAKKSETSVKVALKNTDVVRVYSSTGNVIFNINGIEEDN